MSSFDVVFFSYFGCLVALVSLVSCYISKFGVCLGCFHLTWCSFLISVVLLILCKYTKCA